MTDDIELLPCPNPDCKSTDIDATFSLGERDGKNCHQAGCMDCSTSGPDADTPDEAAEKWNRMVKVINDSETATEELRQLRAVLADHHGKTIAPSGAQNEVARLDADRLIAAFTLEHQAKVAPKNWFVLGAAQQYLRDKYGTLWYCNDELREKPSFLQQQKGVELRKGLVILDDNSVPWMFDANNGWWHSWNKHHGWITHHKGVFDLIPERCVMSKEDAALYGIDQQALPS